MTERMLEQSLSGENTYTDSIKLKKGYFNISLSGTWTATVTLQRRLHGMKDFQDVDEFTTNIQSVEYEAEDGSEYRFVIKKGDYTSGVVVCRISQ